MNIYHVSQEENNEYDTYSDFVIVCASADVARNANPSTGEPMTEEDWKYRFSSWASSPMKVTVRLVGTAHADIAEGIVCASFHAG